MTSLQGARRRARARLARGNLAALHTTTPLPPPPRAFAHATHIGPPCRHPLACLAPAERKAAEQQAALAAATAQAEAAEGKAHRAELAARRAAEEREAAVAASDLRQREMDRMAGA